MTRFSQIALALSWVFAAFAVFLLAGFMYREPVWLLDPVVMLFASGFALALLIPLGVFGLNILLGFGTRWAWLSALVLSGALMFCLLAAYLVTGADVSRTVLAYETLLVFAILLVNLLPVKFTWGKVAVNLLLFAIAVAPSLTPASLSSFRELVANDSSIDFDDTTTFVISSRHDLKITNHKLFDQRLVQGGGGMIPLGHDRFLIGSAYGRLFDVSLADGEATAVETPVKIPLNRDDYVAEARHPTRVFRVTDVFLVDAAGSRRTLLATHHFWNTERQCLTLRLSETTIDLDNLGDWSPEWRTRFESEPCIVADGLVNQNGGRMEYLTPESILMSVGSHAYEHEAANLGDYGNSSYGKIFEIDLTDWTATVFSSGHRNVQGIYVSGDVVWSTEHGPQGGDELNFLVRGEDYGWPRSTYGTDYGQRTWPMNDGPLPHSHGRKPAFAWVPSIGISNLIRVSGTAFPGWRGDLLIGSLNGASGQDTGMSLYRVAVDGERAVMTERISTGERVRDLVEREDGTVILWDGMQVLQVVEPAAHVFSACTGCHGLRDRETHGIGPDLLGITGDKVASRPGYDYSEALREFGGRWTTERLDAYLQNPSDAVPGTTMVFPGIQDAALRAELIEYLAEAER